MYDTKLYQQTIYVNGQIDAVSTGIIPIYKGSLKNTTTTIGQSKFFSTGLTFFQG